MLDDEKIRPYFPLDATLQGVFDQYSHLLGIRFVEVKDAKVWADGVKLYRIENATAGTAIAYLYVDLFPREGKYGGMMLYQLKGGRAGPGGSYSIPVSALVVMCGHRRGTNRRCSRTMILSSSSTSSATASM